MKNIFLFSFLLFFYGVSYSNGVENPFFQDVKSKKSETTKISIKDFDKDASKYIGKTVEISGIVDHVCKHGGKKMFLVDSKSDGRVKIMLGDDLAAFTQELVGETVKVIGIVDEMKVDEDYINNMESDSEEKVKTKDKELHLKGEHEHDGNKKEEHDQKDKIKELRNKLKNSGKDYLSFFSIKAIEYEIVK